MSCEKQGGPYDRLSLVDGSIEKVHFRATEEIVENLLASISQLSKIEPESTVAGVKRPFVPFSTDVNMTGL